MIQVEREANASNGHNYARFCVHCICIAIAYQSMFKGFSDVTFNLISHQFINVASFI